MIYNDTHPKQKFISLLNIRSICKHTSDFFADNRLNKSPIICYTDTQTTQNTRIPILANILESCNVLRNDNQDKFKSLLIMYNKSVFECIQSESFDGFMFLVLKSKVSKMEIKVILVYHKTAVQIQAFLDCLTYFVTAKETGIILGDFNVDFQSDLLVGSFMQSFNFVQPVSEPTHIRGGLIDHVYVNKDFPLSHQLLATVTPEAVKS